jgi:hypothetical protein
MTDTRAKYIGTTPGADSNTYNIFNTTVAFSGANFLSMLGISKIRVDIDHDNAGTFKWYKSEDRGTNWRQIDQEAVSAPASTETTGREFLVEGYMDWKLDWVNGGSAQDPWEVDIAFIEERGAPS